MCGLFGFQVPDANPLTPGELSVMGFLMGAGAESRGKHSCGFAGYQEDGTILLRKEDEQFTKSGLLKDFGPLRTIIGHTRYATVGARTAENAHPFEYKHIIGAHNGGIYNHRLLEKKYRSRKKFEVDSQHLIAHIADLKAYEELRGYGAVTWLDRYDAGAVYICKMLGGDLVVERLSEGGIVWASTNDIISKSLGAINQWGSSRAVHLESKAIYRVYNGEIEKTEECIELGDYGSSASTWEDLMDADDLAEITERQAKKHSKVTVIPSCAKEDRPVGQSKSSPYNGYADALEHYQRGVTQLRDDHMPIRKQVRSGITAGSLQLDTALNYLYWLTDDDYELVQVECDTMTRRQRRKYKSIANNILYHKVMCTCGGCAIIKLLVCEMIMPADADIPSDMEGCS